MFDDLATERVNPATERLDAAPTEELLRLLNAEDRKPAEAVAREIPAIARAVDAIAERCAAGGRLFYIGAGTSGRLGALDAAEIPPTFGAPPELVQAVIAGGEAALTRAVEGAEDDRAAGARDLAARGFGAADSLVGLSASGRAPYVLGAMDYARSLGAFVAGVATHPRPALAGFADVVIAPDVGAEAIAGSTRLKSGTAQKLVLNMLSTALMVRLGCVHGNLMVCVRPTNEKLRHRARRLVERIAGCDAATAARAMKEAGDVRAAVLMVRLGVSQSEAERRLQEAGGRLRVALDTAPPSC